MNQFSTQAQKINSLRLKLKKKDELIKSLLKEAQTLSDLKDKKIGELVEEINALIKEKKSVVEPSLQIIGEMRKAEDKHIEWKSMYKALQAKYEKLGGQFKLFQREVDKITADMRAKIVKKDAVIAELKAARNNKKPEKA